MGRVDANVRPCTGLGERQQTPRALLAGYYRGAGRKVSAPVTGSPEEALRDSLTATTCIGYGLTVHEEKTRLLRFRSPGGTEGAGPGASFPFLGFTHYWGRSRRGNWIVKRKTAADRLTRCGQCPCGVSATGTRRCGSNEQPSGASYWVTMGITASRAMGARWVLPPRGEVPLVEVAESPWWSPPQLGMLCPADTAVPAAAGSCRSFHLRSKACDLRNRVRQSRTHGSGVPGELAGGRGCKSPETKV